ncbi:hypothetical protein OIU34_11205 [Pararhizobium sp. BT-229]|uniref:hypothetical protein n=1 Tax=Pararhizobium sp. BT-229 TaxID=2986923 RepID=UPI0021F6CD4A|nr:hypothetical protein [Pararhizobium sp. BT-229]MCV9962469.1 hypothetical protein [Pararhizobium sp. BT-229]
MHIARQIVRDRISFSAISALFAVVLLLQGLSTGFAQGGVAAAVADPFNILCIDNEVSSAAHAKPVNGPAKHAQCPCATLCQQSYTVAATIPVAADGLIRPDGRWTPVEIIRSHLVPPLPAIGLVAEARAPPTFSAV